MTSFICTSLAGRSWSDQSKTQEQNLIFGCGSSCCSEWSKAANLGRLQPTEHASNLVQTSVEACTIPASNSTQSMWSTEASSWTYLSLLLCFQEIDVDSIAFRNVQATELTQGLAQLQREAFSHLQNTKSFKQPTGKCITPFLEEASERMQC